jgi:cobalt-precorrin 5A hydrolase
MPTTFLRNTGKQNMDKVAATTVAIIAVSEQGAALASVLKSKMPLAEVFVYVHYAVEGQTSFSAVSRLVAEIWERCEGLIFLCASGIAVRAIAPLLKSKHSDPAVVVCGDTGAFAISLLSGHEGGANALALETAALIGAVPVITTASEASPRITPRNLSVGMGCRKGLAADRIRRVFDKVFAETGLSPLRVCRLGTIDIKRDEEGLNALAHSLGVELSCFSAEALNSAALNAASDGFTASDFVREITGTDNVCERAACLGLAGRLIVRKTARDGVTVAVFEKEYR